MMPRLASNSWHSCCSLQSAGITGVHHCTGLAVTVSLSTSILTRKGFGSKDKKLLYVAKVLQTLPKQS
jgi:hypothetical protein